MTWIDIVLLIIIIGLMIHGIIIGLIKGIFDIIGLVSGYLLAINFSGLLKIHKFLAFGLIFVIVVIFVSLLGRLVSKMMHITPLGGVDRMLGGLLGFLKGFIVSFVFLIILIMTSKVNATLYKSEVAHWVIRGGLTASQVLPGRWFKWLKDNITKRELVFIEDHKILANFNENYHLPL